MLNETPGLFLKFIQDPTFMNSLSSTDYEQSFTYQKVKNSSIEISTEKLNEMSDWSQEIQVRMVKQIMRKTSDKDDLEHFQ